jgi:ABC-type branched-subunit amino acid transport system permease subunit
MHGDYLAIVTLGFGEIIRLVLNNWVSFTGVVTDVEELMDGDAAILSPAGKFEAKQRRGRHRYAVAFRCCACMATTWLSSPSALAKLSAWCSTTG